MNNLAPGKMVVVVHSDDPDQRYLIGEVGTIEAPLSYLEQLVTGADWRVELPNATPEPCRNCGEIHNTAKHWAFKSYELRLLDDPDSDLSVEETVEEDLETVA